MTLHCRQVQKALRAFHDGTMPGECAAAIEAHLGQCAGCRTAARRQALTKLLRAGSRAPAPAPSDFFMTRLRGALQDCPPPQPAPAMAELLVRAGLRLAPAMAAMALIISISSAWFAAPAYNALLAAPAEELLLEDHPLSTDLILAALTGETIER
ncbi:MAG: zf-HC2 domain-containing protein [Deltaproteobacteria bacterium]|nr:zf-HC2 domain-containing protein [Deltaproteobacteria bacterium]